VLDAVEGILKETDGWRPDLIVFSTQGHRDFLDVLRGIAVRHSLAPSIVRMVRQKQRRYALLRADMKQAEFNIATGQTLGEKKGFFHRRLGVGRVIDWD
jgi:hypothetical protein